MIRNCRASRTHSQHRALTQDVVGDEGERVGRPGDVLDENPLPRVRLPVGPASKPTSQQEVPGKARELDGRAFGQAEVGEGKEVKATVEGLADNGGGDGY